MPDDSMTFDFLVEKPMTVRKIRVIMEAPRRVDESGVDAAAG